MAIALSVAYTATPLAAGTKLVIEATRQLSAGINFQQRGAYKVISVTAAAAASPANILAAYIVIFGALISGTKILFRAYTINAAGVASPVFQFSKVVV